MKIQVRKSNNNAILVQVNTSIGDLWECLRVVFTIFWGTPSDSGTLCNMREFISRRLVNKTVKVFMSSCRTPSRHISHICSIFGVDSPTAEIEHTCSLQWLEEKAKVIVAKTIHPTIPLKTHFTCDTAPFYILHSSTWTYDVQFDGGMVNTSFGTGRCGSHD